jgi:hypothetical protein
VKRRSGAGLSDLAHRQDEFGAAEMFGFFGKRKYKAAVETDIQGLFAAMPKEYLPYASRLVNVERAIDQYYQRGTPAKECAIYCAAFLTAAPIQRMDQEIRNDLLRQYKSDEPAAFSVGLNVMLITAMKLTKNLATIDVLGSEILGTLYGMSREEKDQWLEQLGRAKLAGRLPPWAS